MDTEPKQFHLLGVTLEFGGKHWKTDNSRTAIPFSMMLPILVAPPHQIANSQKALSPSVSGTQCLSEKSLYVRPGPANDKLCTTSKPNVIPRWCPIHPASEYWWLRGHLAREWPELLLLFFLLSSLCLIVITSS